MAADLRDPCGVVLRACWALKRSYDYTCDKRKLATALRVKDLKCQSYVVAIEIPPLHQLIFSR